MVKFICLKRVVDKEENSKLQSGVRDNLRLYDQVNKCTRWMPWRQQAKKDVEICEKPREADNRQ